MKDNKGILIAVVLVVVIIAAYFLTKNKSTTGNATVTQTRESTTGVASLFNTGAMSALFGGLGKASDAIGGSIGTTNNAPKLTREQYVALGYSNSDIDAILLG